MKRKIALPLAFISVFILSTLVATAFVCSVFAQPSDTTNEGDEATDQTTAIFQGWQVYDLDGYYSESNGTIRIWSDTQDHGVALYKEILPKTDFQFSLQVKALALNDSFGIFVGKDSFPKGSYEGVNFEFHEKWGTPTFLLARYLNAVNYETGTYESVWGWQGFAVGRENVWYTMKLTVQADPFRISGEVVAENGVSLGSFSVSDMINLSFKDITCIGFKNTWGGDYYIRNISNLTPITKGSIQTHISIFAEGPSSTIDSAVTIEGKLTELNSTALKNETVVLWYTFAGLDQWVPISSSFTNEEGDYSIQWLITASGNFTLRADWLGNSTHLGTSNTTILSVLPNQSETVLHVESNSTVAGLDFDSGVSELGFSDEKTGITSPPPPISEPNQSSTLESAMLPIEPFNVDYRVLLGVVVALLAVSIIVLVAVGRMKRKALHSQLGQ